MYVVNNVNIGTYKDLSKGFFVYENSACHVFLGFQTFDVAYIVEKSVEYSERFIRNFLEFTDNAQFGLLMRAYETCENKLPKNLNFWEGAVRDDDYTTTVSSSYEFGCEYQNTYPSFTDLAKDNITDGELVKNTIDPYTIGNPSVVDIINVVERDFCVKKFFEKCAEGHENNFQNPFLTFYAFMKVEEYINSMFPSGSDQTGRCDINIFKSTMFCPQCPDVNMKEIFQVKILN